MQIKKSFAEAFKFVRRAQRITQEDFDAVSSRTYISKIERGLQSPTLAKIDELAVVLQIHPITLIALAYAKPSEIDQLLNQIKSETVHILATPAHYKDLT